MLNIIRPASVNYAHINIIPGKLGRGKGGSENFKGQ